MESDLDSVFIFASFKALFIFSCARGLPSYICVSVPRVPGVWEGQTRISDSLELELDDCDVTPPRFLVFFFILSEHFALHKCWLFWCFFFLYWIFRFVYFIHPPFPPQASYVDQIVFELTDPPVSFQVLGIGFW